MNINGEGPRGATVSAMPLGTHNAPVDLTFSVGTEGVLLRWSPPPDREGSGNLTYLVLRGMTKTSLSILSEVTDPLAYQDGSAQVGLTYFYSVLAVNPYGVEGPRATPIEVLMAFVPGAISNLMTTAGDGIVNLTWAMPGSTGGVPITGYIILRGPSEDELIEIGRTTGTSYEDIFVTNGERLWYAVQAVNAAGVGPQSSLVDATPRARPPPPEGLRIVFKDGKAILRWVAPSGDYAPVSGYIVYKGPSITDMGDINDVGLVTEYIDAQVEPGKVYFYTVKARSDVGEGAKAVPVKL
jgi:hypothetical protein